MIAYSYIEKNIRELVTRYNKARTIKEANYYSKVAVLELCGWIEMSIDDLIDRVAARLITTPKLHKRVMEKIKKTYGFEFEKHFQTLIVEIIGVYGLEKIQANINPQVLANFISELTILKEKRNSLAHTYTKGITQNYDAPSITLSRLHLISAGMREYDAALKVYI